MDWSCCRNGSLQLAGVGARLCPTGMVYMRARMEAPISVSSSGSGLSSGEGPLVSIRCHDGRLLITLATTGTKHSAVPLQIYNAVSALKKSHKKDFITRLSGQNMGCILQIPSLWFIFCPSQCSDACNTVDSSWASYGVPIVSIFDRNDRAITAPHCIMLYWTAL